MGGKHRGRALAIVLAAIAAVGAGCGDDERPDATGSAAAPRTTADADGRTTVDADARERLMAIGKRVFVKQCNFCHRLAGKRPASTPPPDAYGPSFDHVKPTEAYVVKRVTGGATAMGTFEGLLSPQKIRAVAVYVSTLAGRDVAEIEPSAATMAAGERVFEQRCQRCHTLADRELTGDSRWMPTDFNDVRPSAAFVRSLLTGEGNAFLVELMAGIQGKLSAKEIRAVAAYVSALGGPS
jgi:mono/diheme cytochrome c family protein